MSEWRSQPVAQLVKDGRISYGIVQPGSASAGGVPIIRAGDIRGGVLDVSGPLVVAPSVSERHARTVLRGGEVLISVVGNIGATAVVPAALAGWNVARAIAVLHPVGVHRRWLAYALEGPQARYQIDSRLNTTVQPTLNLADLCDIELSVPPLPEQQAIAEVLGALDDKIAANTKLADSADGLAVALVASSLGGDRALLSEIAEITMGSSPKGEALNEHGEGVPFFQGVRDFGFRAPAHRVFTTAPVRMTAPGDILVSVRAPVGEVNRTSEAVCIGRGVAAVRSRHECSATLFHLLRSERSAWEPYEAEGTVFGSINRNQLHGISLQLPDASQADGLELKLRNLEATIDSALAENRSLAATRDALLPQLMSGKLRVRDAEAAASAVGV